MFGGTFSIMHWLVVLAVVLLLFGGRGKVSAIMGDFGKGLRNFKTGLKATRTRAATGDEAEEVEVIEAAPRRRRRRPLPRKRRRPRKRLLRKRRLPRRSPLRRKKPPRKAK